MVGTAGGRVLGTVSGCVKLKCHQMSGRCSRLRLRERAQGSIAYKECFKYFHVKWSGARRRQRRSEESLGKKVAQAT